MIRKYLFLIIYGFCMFALYAKDENLDKTSIVSQTVAVICIVGTIIVGIQQSEEKIEELENNLEILSMKLIHYILRSDTLDVKDIGMELILIIFLQKLALLVEAVECMKKNWKYI